MKKIILFFAFVLLPLIFLFSSLFMGSSLFFTGQSTAKLQAQNMQIGGFNGPVTSSRCYVETRDFGIISFDVYHGKEVLCKSTNREECEQNYCERGTPQQ